DVFKRGETVSAAILVDDKRHLDTISLHPRHEIGRKHRRRHEEKRTDQTQLADRAAEIDPGQVERPAADSLLPATAGSGLARNAQQVADDIANVDHAARVIERLAVDGQTRMPGL